jgi:hypothetical protein
MSRTKKLKTKKSASILEERSARKRIANTQKPSRKLTVLGARKVSP